MSISTTLSAKQAEAVRLYTTPGIYNDNDPSKQTYKNQTQSAIGAGYVARFANHNIKQIFTEKALVVVHTKEQELARKADVTVEQIVQGLKELAFPVTGDGAVMVNNGDRIRSMELLGKHKAMFKEIAINLNADIPSDPALRLTWCKEEIDRIEANAGILTAYATTETAIAKRF